MTAYIEIDRAALKRDAEKLLHGSPLWDKIQGGLILNLRNAGISATALGDLIQATIASVEIVKQNALKMEDPDGSKGLRIDNNLALDTALELLDDAITFKGILAPVDWFDRPVMHFLIEVGLAAYRGKDWILAAKTILALV